MKTGNSVGHVANVFRKHWYRRFFRDHKDLKEKYTKQDLYEVRDKLFSLVQEVMVSQPNGVVLNGIGYKVFVAFRKKQKYTKKLCFALEE